MCDCRIKFSKTKIASSARWERDLGLCPLLAYRDEEAGNVQREASSVLIEVRQWIAEGNRIEVSTGVELAGTSHSVVVDKRSSHVDVEETSSPKRGKWKRLARLNQVIQGCVIGLWLQVNG
ncbi:hypothetical protein ACOSQ2_018850 [Xanthoceras sorbifolium]